jgi:hypothetical protein
VIDVGKPRTTSDILKIAGVTDYNIVAAGVRNVLAYDRTAGQAAERLNMAKRGVTAQQILAFVQTDRGERLLDLLPSARRIGHGIGNSGIANAVVAALVVINEAAPLPLTYHEFVERLTDGAMLPPSSPILALRRWLVSDGGWFGTTAKVKAENTIALMIKCWNAYVLGQSRQIMVFKGSEPMPRVIGRPPVEGDGSDAA